MLYSYLLLLGAMQQATKDKLKKFFSQYKTSNFKKGKIILQPHKNITHIYYIKSGLVRQFALSPDGGKLTIHIFKHHSYIPYVLLLSNSQNNYTYQAVSDTEVAIAPARDVELFLLNNPDVLYVLVIRLSDAITGLLKKIEHSAFDDAYTRVLSLITYLAGKYGDKKEGNSRIALPNTHFDLASWLGMHRETISRQLLLLQKKKIVIYDHRRIMLVNVPMALEELGRL